MTLPPSGPGYDVIITSEVVDGVLIFVASNPAIQRCYSQGRTRNEAIANLQDARDLIVEHLKSFSLPFPDPVPTPRVIDQQVTVAAPSAPFRSVEVAA